MITAPVWITGSPQATRCVSEQYVDIESDRSIRLRNDCIVVGLLEFVVVEVVDFKAFADDAVAFDPGGPVVPICAVEQPTAKSSIFTSPAAFRCC